MRLASSRMLHTDSRDLSATSQTDRGKPIVILYDAVPGGAGYVRRLGGGGAFATAALVDNAIRILECPEGCASSCAKCLNDYGNQVHWDVFDRHAVLGWLKDLRANNVLQSGIAPPGAVRWQSPSLEGLRQALVGARRLEIFVNQIHGGTDENVATRTAQFLRGLVESGSDREVRIYAESLPRLSSWDLHGGDLRALGILAELEEQGRLKLYSSAQIDEGTLCPRVAADVSGGGACFFAGERERPLLDGLLPGSHIFREGTLSIATKAVVDEITGRATRKQNALSGLIKDTKRFEYRPFQNRDLSEPFAPLNGADGVRLLIRDPYLLSRQSNIEGAALLIRQLNHLCATLKTVTLVWRLREGSFATHNQSESQLFQTELKRQKLSFLDVRHRPKRKGEGGHFHDRWITARFKRYGSEQTYRWDLTSGVDNLMDIRKEATVFLTRIG